MQKYNTSPKPKENEHIVTILEAYHIELEWKNQGVAVSIATTRLWSLNTTLLKESQNSLEKLLIMNLGRKCIRKPTTSCQTRK